MAAQEPSELPIALDLSACSQLDETMVVRLLHIELQMDLERTDRPENTTRVAVRCEEDQAELEVDDPTTGKTTSRRIRLTGRSAERLVALAVAELLAASWAEHHVRPRAEVEHLDRTASPETTAAATEAVAGRMLRLLPPPEPPPRPPRWTFGALFASVGVSGRPAHAISGLGVSVGLALNPWVATHFDVTYDVGRVSSAPGRVELRTITAGVALTARYRMDDWVLYGGAGGRAGYAYLRGSGDTGRSLSGRVGGPFVTGGVTLGDGLVLGILSVEVGWYTWSRRGYLGEGPDAPGVAAKDRAWGALRLAVAVRL